MLQRTNTDHSAVSTTTEVAPTVPRLIAYMSLFAAYPVLMGGAMVFSLACAQLFA